jgi:seryl-tRNA synthetase
MPLEKQGTEMNAVNEAERQRADIQRDLGRLEGKVDSLLTAMQNMLQSMVRADAERDNLARDMANVEQKATAAMNKMREEFQRNHSDLRSKLYWLGGVTTAGGVGLGAGASKILSVIFLGH